MAVQKLLNTCFNEAKQTLIDHRNLLDEISEFLLAKETITGDEMMAYINADQNPPVQEETTEEA